MCHGQEARALPGFGIFRESGERGGRHTVCSFEDVVVLVYYTVLKVGVGTIVNNCNAKDFGHHWSLQGRCAKCDWMAIIKCSRGRDKNLQVLVPN